MKKIFALFMTALLTFGMCSCAAEKESTGSQNENGVEVDGAVVSWGNLEIDNSKLTEDQKEVLKYFDSDYFMINNYDSFQKYPEIYRGTQVKFDAAVIDVLQTDDEKYEALVSMNAYIDENTGEPVILDETALLVVSGNHPDDGRIVKDDCLSFYGRFIDVQEYEIDGKKEYYPHVTVNYTLTPMANNGGSMGTPVRFGLDEIEKVAKIIFGEDIKIKEPVYGEDFELDELHYPENPFYLVTLDDQSNANFSQFEFWRNDGFIMDANSTFEVYRTLSVSADFQHYIVTIFDQNLNMTYMEYYDRDFEKIWSREFKGTENIAFDYTENDIYFVANNDFYVIDVKTGEDKIEPVIVGEKLRASAISDGVILIGTGNKDNIMKVDFEGNVVWKTSVDLEVSYCDIIQVVDDRIITVLSDYGNVGGSQMTDKMVAVDSDGNVISEFNSLQLGSDDEMEDFMVQ